MQTLKTQIRTWALQIWGEIDEMPNIADSETIELDFNGKTREISPENWLPLNYDDLIICIFKNNIYVGSTIDCFTKKVTNYKDVLDFVNSYND